jgi:hypothetical protein
MEIITRTHAPHTPHRVALSSPSSRGSSFPKDNRSPGDPHLWLWRITSPKSISAFSQYSPMRHPSSFIQSSSEGLNHLQRLLESIQRKHEPPPPPKSFLSSAHLPGNEKLNTKGETHQTVFKTLKTPNTSPEWWSEEAERFTRPTHDDKKNAGGLVEDRDTL